MIAFTRLRAALVLTAAVSGIGWARPSWAHKPSDSYLQLSVQRGPSPSHSEQHWQGHWDLALWDLDRELTLDTDGNGQLTWGELRARESAVLAHALAGLKPSTTDGPCTTTAGALQLAHHSDGMYARVPMQLHCPASATAPGPTSAVRLTVRSALFFHRDPQHRTLVDLSDAADPPRATTLILTSTSPQQTATLPPSPSPSPSPDSESSTSTSTSTSTKSDLRSPAFFTFVREGVWHIWIGLDHVLFLLALLLPAVLRRQDGRWVPVTALGPAMRDVARVVTAFTLAHSLTLALAALGVVRVSSSIIEPAIAASVVLAAVNNVWPLFGRDRWVMASALGLLHGFGFSSVLADVGLPRDRLLSGLLGFNLGVELGQLALITLFVPLTFLVRNRTSYRRVVLVGGSLAIAGLAVLWFVERTLDVSIIS